MFRDQDQLHQACGVLCAGVHASNAWTPTGPSNSKSHLSTGQRIVVQVCLDIFNGTGNASLPDLIRWVDKTNLERIFSLLTALQRGPAAIDQWLESHKPQPPSVGES